MYWIVGGRGARLSGRGWAAGILKIAPQAYSIKRRRVHLRVHVLICVSIVHFESGVRPHNPRVWAGPTHDAIKLTCHGLG